MSRAERPQTPDGRYIVARGILKRCTNPDLDDQARRKALKKLMQARMSADKEAVQTAKIELGEAGPVWWDDGALDLSGTAPDKSPYADWWCALSESEQASGRADSRLKK
jgi:hypothetical protein